jgi:predicted regulator of Ras-like GTPase activity (Roadblock/LC7/MglB family)
MKSFPSLTAADVEHLDSLLKDLVTRSRAHAVLLVERAGYLIHRAGGDAAGDPAEFSSLAANAFNAAQEMSKRLKESFFTTLRVSGTRFHTSIRHVDETSLLVVIFDTNSAPEQVEAEAFATVIGIYERLEIARHRKPDHVVDFADEDVESVTKFFRRQAANPPPDPPAAPPAS